MARKSKKSLPTTILLQNAALELAATKAWGQISMADIAEAAGLSLGETLRTYPSKHTIIQGYLNQVEEETFSSIDAFSPDDGVRDRLFDLIMNRLDHLNAHKNGLVAVARVQINDPVSGLCLLLQHKRALKLMLEAAGISTSGVRGALLLKGLALVYANAVRVWIKDDSKDLAKTMAAVDQGLEKAEKIASRLKISKKRNSNEPIRY